MAIDHPRDLHERADDRGTGRIKPAPSKVFTDYIGFFGFIGKFFKVPETAADRLITGQRTDIAVKAAGLFRNLKERDRYVP